MDNTEPMPSTGPKPEANFGCLFATGPPRRPRKNARRRSLKKQLYIQKPPDKRKDPLDLKLNPKPYTLSPKPQLLHPKP